MRRGRRPHPDILTPRQWEVLELLRLGLTDPEIAQRLGLSLDGAKYHVSEILSKLGVTSREEAAAWQAAEPASQAGEPVSRRGLVWGALGLGILGAAAVSIGVLVWGTAQSGTGSEDRVIDPPQTVEEFVDDLERSFAEGDLGALYALYTPGFREQCSLAELEDEGAEPIAVPGAELAVVDFPTPEPGENVSDLFLSLRGAPGDGEIEIFIPTRVDADGIWIAPFAPGSGDEPLSCRHQFGALNTSALPDLAQIPPRIGEDHWHAPYEFIVCGERQPDAPTWEGVGVHTHGDGVIHIHPFTAAEEGLGARLTKWFQYGAGVLSSDEVRLPGLSRTWTNGQVCPSNMPAAGETGTVQVFANGDPVELDAYIPQDGDRVKVVFGPPDDGQWEGEVSTVGPDPSP